MTGSPDVVEARYMIESRMSLGDSVARIWLMYPSKLSPEEFEDVKDFVAIWMRQLERSVTKLADRKEEREK